MKPPLRFAVIGCGALARTQHIPNLVASPQTGLEVCCDASATVLAECQAKFSPRRTTTDFKQAVNDPAVQAICLATTEKLRLPVIEAAAAAGKPIYVEKPLARELDEMYAIQKVVHQAGIPFCIGHNRRSAPAMIDAQRIFRAHMDNPQPCPWRWDREGDRRPVLPESSIPSISIRINDDWYSWKVWVFDKNQAPYGPMLFEMTHFVDMANWFLQDDPLEVMAFDAGLLNSTVSIRYRQGALATIVIGSNGSFGYPKELYEAMGQGGVVAVQHMVEVITAGIAGAPARTNYPLSHDRFPDVGVEGGISGWLAKRQAAAQAAAATGDGSQILCGEPDKGHRRMLERFVDEITGTGPVVCGVDDAVLATRTCLAAIRSAKERRIVKLDEL